MTLPGYGCLWDTDTLAAEQARFPEVAEMITGTFARHSKEFHEWRQEKAQKAIESDPSALLQYDDLAVSQHKLGDHKAAIATMMAKEKRAPGVYETYSNLGTFYIYTGQLDEAKKWIEKALSINANAHFGREKYQLWLVEWLMEGGQTKRYDNKSPVGGAAGFALYVAGKHPHDKASTDPRGLPQLSQTARAEAINAVLGMMWFADHDNPLLLEALGDLLEAGKMKENGAQLAALAYLHASRKVAANSERQRLENMAEQTVSTNHDLWKNKMAVSGWLDKGLAKGLEYADTVRQDEMTWIAEGKDAAKEFQKKYLPEATKK